MIRISLSYIYNLSLSFDRLERLDVNKDRFDIIWTLHSVEINLKDFLEDSVFSTTLRSSAPYGRKLLADLQNIRTGFEKLTNQIVDHEESFVKYGLFPIKKSFEQYKITLLAKLEDLTSYLVTQKRGYDTAILLEAGDVLSPPSLPTKTPEALRDAIDAAKALAFEMGSAFGFHPYSGTRSGVASVLPQGNW